MPSPPLPPLTEHVKVLLAIPRLLVSPLSCSLSSSSSVRLCSRAYCDHRSSSFDVHHFTRDGSSCSLRFVQVRLPPHFKTSLFDSNSPLTRPAVRRPSRPSYSTTEPATTRTPRPPVSKTSLLVLPLLRSTSWPPAASAPCRPTRTTGPQPPQSSKSTRSARPCSFRTVNPARSASPHLPRRPKRLGSRSHCSRLLCRFRSSQSRRRR